MSSLLHVCLYNTDSEASPELEGAIRSLNFVRLVAETNSPEQLVTTLQDTGINIVFFHLDPRPGLAVEVIDQISTQFPNVALIAISHQTDPEAILAPMRAGCDQFVCEPIDLPDLTTAVKRVASKRFQCQPKSRCICVTGAGGGVGTTSISCNLALEIGNLTDRDCALVDLDLQFGVVALAFDLEPKFTLHDLAVAGAGMDRTVLSSTLNELPCKVAVLARPELIEQQEAVTPDTIHRVVDLLMAEYESVVIDVPRFLTPSTTAAFAHADLIFLVCQLLVPSIRNAKRYYDTLIQLGVAPERIEVVVNRSDGRSGRITAKDISETIKKPPYACVPNDFQFVARSIDFGRPIASLDQNSPVRSAIRKMAKKVLSDTGSETQMSGDRRGILSRLFTR